MSRATRSTLLVVSLLTLTLGACSRSSRPASLAPATNDAPVATTPSNAARRIAPLPPSLDCSQALAPLPAPTDPAHIPSPPIAGVMTETATIANRRFEAEMWGEAYEDLSRVARGETGDDKGNRDKAAYRAAISLYQLGRRADAAKAFRTIARDPARREQEGSLPWLVKLAAEDPSLVEVMDFAHYEKEVVFRLDGPGAAEIAAGAAYFVGLHRLASGKDEDARELFERVPDEHPYRPSARRCLQRLADKRGRR